jgi:hypothetical protein
MLKLKIIIAFSSRVILSEKIVRLILPNAYWYPLVSVVSALYHSSCLTAMDLGTFPIILNDFPVTRKECVAPTPGYLTVGFIDGDAGIQKNEDSIELNLSRHCPSYWKLGDLRRCGQKIAQYYDMNFLYLNKYLKQAPNWTKSEGAIPK